MSANNHFTDAMLQGSVSPADPFDAFPVALPIRAA
jgi:hypothetical protein